MTARSGSTGVPHLGRPDGGRRGGEDTRPTTAVVDGSRLLRRLDELATTGRGSNGSAVTRLAWTADDLAARELIAVWAADAGAACRVDAAGNLIGEVAGIEPGLPALAMGSHLDTVVNGGRLDGAYGVVAAVEVIAALAAAGNRLRHTLRLVAFANEEGVVAPPFTGSRAIAGQGEDIDLAAIGPDGRCLARRIEAAGGDPAGLAGAAWPAVAGFVELHIEQGPILDAAGIRLGVVTGITGRFCGDIVIDGRANHAGTTPMDLRRDAVVAAAHAVLAINALAMRGHVDVATAGQITCRPGITNVVADQATVSVDFRCLDDARCVRARDRLATELRHIAAITRTDIALLPTAVVNAVPTDLWLQGVIAAAAGDQPTISIASGAGHDAQHMAALGPVGMIFVPSIEGVSHCPEEATDADDLVLGATTLLAALIEADRGR